MVYQRIDFKTAKAAIIENHYSHSCPSVSWAFGAYDEGKLVGVLTVGKFARSSTTSEGVCGKSRADDVFELNRLWMSDDLPVTVTDKQGRVHSAGVESKFIGWCLRELKKERPSIVIVSYADTRCMDKKTKVVHRSQVGTIYQATNGVYTGCTPAAMDLHFPSDYERGRDYRDSSKECRGALVKVCGCGRSITKMLKQDAVTCACGYEWASGIGGGKRPWVCLVKDCKWHTLGEKAVKIPRSRKHRYVWFAGDDLKWDKYPYPRKEQ